MDLPKIVARFVNAQNTFNSEANVECFTDTGIVHDEGRTHIGKEKIREWIEEANEKYRSVIKPLQYDESGFNGVLTSEVSGTFPGSPIVLKFHLELNDGLIDSLNVTN